jgi:hypothetical protein
MRCTVRSARVLTHQAKTHKEVLQQIVAVLVISPGLQGSQDALAVLDDSLSLVAETRGARGGSASSLERVRVDDKLEHLGELGLGSTLGQSGGDENGSTA